MSIVELPRGCALESLIPPLLALCDVLWDDDVVITYPTQKSQVSYNNNRITMVLTS